mgnify:CR=1 FL=1
MGWALPVGIEWWIGKRTEGGFAGGVDNEGKVARSCMMSWMRSVGDTRYCVLLMWVVSRGLVKSAIGR